MPKQSSYWEPSGFTGTQGSDVRELVHGKPPPLTMPVPSDPCVSLGVQLKLSPLNDDFDTRFTKMWDESVEILLQKYCDEAQTRESLHRKSYYAFKRSGAWFSLPIIVLSALSGSFQFLSKGYPAIEQYIVTGTASLSILTSILAAVASYLKLGEGQSKHEQSANAWLLFHNEVKHQLGLRRDLRQEPAEFLQNCKTSYDRLFELSPICSSYMIGSVKKEIEKHATEQFVVPTYLNGWRHSTVYRVADDDFEENSA